MNVLRLEALAASLLFHGFAVWALATALRSPPFVERRVEVDLARVERPERHTTPPPDPFRPPSPPQVPDVPRPVEPPLPASQELAEDPTASLEPTRVPRPPPTSALPTAAATALIQQVPDATGITGRMSATPGPAPPAARPLPDPGPAVSRLVSPPGTAAGAGVEAVDAYFAKIRARIEGAKRYPRWAEREGVEGRVTLSFHLNPDGVLTAARVAASSGSRALDEAALAALKRGAPYPRFPEDPSSLPDEIQVLVVFDLR